MNSSFTRREFLAISAASLGTMSFAHLKLQKEPEPIVAGFIGTGAQGQMLLGKCLRVPGVRFAGICDIYEPHLNKALQVCGGTAKGYKDYREMLDDKSIQAVLIATPLYLHAPMAIAALEAGKHVFCEKTMARRPEQAKAMARAVDRTRKWLQIGHQRRASELYQHAYDMVAKKKVLGTVTQIRARWHRNGSWRRNVPPEYERLLNWRLYEEYSGGLMAELGSHQIHLVNWFTDSNPIAVTGFGGIDYWKDGREVFDNVSVVYEYPNGLKVVYTSITTNQFDGYGEHFMGDKGTLEITVDKGLLFKEPAAEAPAWASLAHKEQVGGKEAIVLDASATKKRVEGEKHGESSLPKSTVDDYQSELNDFFLKTVLRNERPLCDHVEGLRTCVAILGANTAMEKRQRVDFSPADFQYDTPAHVPGTQQAAAANPKERMSPR